MKVLITSTPVIGHVNPMLVAAQVLESAGHTTAMYTGTLFREKIEAAGVRFFPLPSDVDYDMRDIHAAFPERQQHEPGIPQLLFDMKTFVVDSMPSQFRGLKAVLHEFPADLLIHETGFCGVLPLLLGPRSARPISAYLGISTLMLPREDGAPFGPGLQPATDAAQRKQYSAIARDIDAALTNPVREHADSLLRNLGVPELPASLFESIATLADLILQPSVSSFEYPLRETPEKLHFIGALLPKGSGDLPPQVKQAKESGKKIVLVSQGTIANGDLGKLVVPVIQALGIRKDVLILATTGGKPIDTIPHPLSANTIASPFLNFREILPYVDVLVAIGGYGTVTQALSFGVPMVLGGLSEEKPEINARVAWTGSGIDLRTDNPTPTQIHDAVEQILSNPSYRTRAKELSQEFAAHDSAKELTHLLETLVADQQVLAG
jgi:UDP:flavonoid glycosyltransferase YjiC (YdhE family)